MPSNSFRKDLGPPPLRYRTPSPPRFAFEPISPISVNDSPFEELGAEGPSWNKSNYEFEKPQHTHSQSVEDFHTQKDRLQGAMDTFASIALATNPASATQPHPSLVHPPGGLVFTDEVHEAERPSKRARSEKIHSAEWVREGTVAGIRPATSYEQSPDTRTFEAELLLNFSHKARFANTHVFNGEVNRDVPQRIIESPPSAPHDSKPFPSNTSRQDRLGTDAASNFTAEPLPNGVMGEKTAENIPGVLDATPQPASPKQQNLSPITRANEHRGVEITEETPRSQESGPEDIYNEPRNLVVELGVGILDNGRADDYTATATLNDMRDGAIEEAGPISSNTREKPPDLENDESQIQRQKRTLNEVEASTAPPNDLFKQIPAVDSEDVISVGQEEQIAILSDNGSSNAELKAGEATASATCTACHFSRNSSSVDSENNSTSWISCDACKAWFHFACAGFKSEREVRSVDKYRCRKCKAEHGSTTYVRKSSRAHSAIDYAGLNQGVIKTSDERPEHHYIRPIKDGVITFLPENFPRMRPELVTADFFERGNGMKEPVVIPASLNPRPRPTGTEDIDPAPSVVEEWLSRNAGLQRVLDDGQDALDMVMPQNMTVRMVSELYGPEERVEVIDVKSQNGEGKKWNMRRWADYYESSKNKAVRNVISLEVSQSKLGRLIRRPKVVRDLDLQDSVWPQELQQKGEYPRVQLYCLMSVADCFTDFHIDFGGSSVFYHILKGKKTFLFIPPKEKHLKKYEEWCKSPAQNWTFLADQTKECYRVDLAEGDTMLIPAGWIHAVWTPEDSLVIGGNFLSRMHYGMQFRIAQTEKATGVARKFRYPHFQKLHWYVALKYLHDDPLPDNVKELVQEGGVFHRDRPTHHEFDAWGENSMVGFENYHSRYYAQAELEGLPDLTRYLLRTALIDLGSITEGISAETRNAVKRAIPRGYGEPLEVVKEFAMWCAWKRGNEPIPHWAYPDAILEGGASDSVGKLSAAASKKLDQDAALQAPRRQSARRQQQQERQRQKLSTEAAQRLSGDVSVLLEGTNQGIAKPAAELSTPATPVPSALTTPSKRKSSELTSPGHDGSVLDVSKKRKKNSRSGPASNRKPACEVCRKRRRACKHRDEGNSSVSGIQALEATGNANFEGSGPQKSGVDGANTDDKQSSLVEGEQGLSGKNLLHSPSSIFERLDVGFGNEPRLPRANNDFASALANDASNLVGERASASRLITPKIEKQTNSSMPRGLDTSSGNTLHSRGRTKACNDCRKSKVCEYP